MVNYPIGVTLAITAGICLNIGFVLQKKAINQIPADARESKLFATLIKNKTWLTGLIVQILGSAVLVMIAQFFIGPALIPGLMAAGLIAMVIGASKILNESLKKEEYIGIGFMIVAIILLSMTGLSVDVTEQNLLDTGFLTRVSVFTIILFIIILLCEILQRKYEAYRGILLGLQSGSFLGLANFWVSPFTVNLSHLFEGALVIPDELILGVVGGIMLAITNVFAISTLQKAFTCAQASNVVPLQQIPINIAPIFVYFGIFALSSPTPYSIPLMISGICLIVVSSYFLAKRQAQLEEIV